MKPSRLSQHLPSFSLALSTLVGVFAIGFATAQQANTEPAPDPGSASQTTNSTDTSTNTSSDTNPPAKDYPTMQTCEECSEATGYTQMTWEQSSTESCDIANANPSSILLHYSLGTVSYETTGNASSAYEYAIRDGTPQTTGPESLKRPVIPGLPQKNWGQKIRRVGYIQSYSEDVTAQAASFNNWKKLGSLGSGTENTNSQGSQYVTMEFVTDLAGDATSTLISTFHRNTVGDYNNTTKRYDTSNAHLARTASVTFTEPNILTYEIKEYRYDQNIAQTFGPESLNPQGAATVIKQKKYTYEKNGNTWKLTLYKAAGGNYNPDSRITYTKTINGVAKSYACHVEHAYPSVTTGQLAFGTIRNFIIDFVDFSPKQKRITRFVNNPNTPEELTTHFSYSQLDGSDSSRITDMGPGNIPTPTNGSYTAKPHNEILGLRLKSIVRSDGYWRLFTYADNRASQIYNVTSYEVWKNIPITQHEQARKLVFTATGNELHYIESIAGQTTSSITAKFSSTTPAGATQPITTIRVNRSTGDPAAPLVEEYGYNKNGNRAYIRHSDGTLTRHTYTNVNGYPTTTTENGVIDAAQSAPAATGPVNGTFTAGTRTEVSENFFEKPVSIATYDIASNLLLERQDVLTTDAMGRPNKTIYNLDPNDYQEITYHCCGIESIRERDGSVTTNHRDELGIVHYTVTVLGSRTITNTSSRALKTLNGKATIWNKQTRSVTAGTNTVDQFLGETYRNLAGQTILSISPDHNGDGQPEETSYTYNSNSRTTSVTGPDGTTSTSTRYADGQQHTSVTTANIGGSATAITPLTTYDYTLHNLNGGGIKTTVTQFDDNVVLKSSSSYADLAGRTIKTESPGYNGAILTSTPLYDERGRNIGATRTGQPAMKYVLNLQGETTEVWTDANGDGEFNDTVVADIKDTCQKTTTDYVTEDGKVCQRTTQSLRTDANADVITATSYTSTDGLYRKSVPLAGTGPITTTTATRPLGGNSSQETRTYLGSNLTSASLVSAVSSVLNANGTSTTTQTNKDTTGAIITTASSTSDLLDRTVTQVGERGLTTSYGNFTESGQPLLTTHSDDTQTRITLDAAARPTKVETLDANGAVKATRHSSYHPSGRVAAQWGDLTNPTYNIYSIQDQLVELRTYKNQTAEPTASTAGYEKTNWDYEPATGLLLNKRYADNKGPDYTYTPNGKLLTKTSAREVSAGTRLKATYDYNSAGRLTDITYNDGSTPNVTRNYNRLGQKTAVSNGVATTDYTYTAATLALDTETITYDIDTNGTPELVRTLDRRDPSLGRDKGWELKNGTAIENEVTLDYSPTNGRLATLSGGLPVPLSGVQAPSPSTFNYNYIPNSNLIATVTSPAHTVTNTYDPDRNVLLTKSNTKASDNTVISSVNYIVNTLGQRTKRTTSDAATSVVTDWSYDALGQVETEDQPGTTDRTYQYDHIGNRKKSANSLTLPQDDNYTTNALNQYTAVDSFIPAYDDDGNQIKAQIKQLSSESLVSCVFYWDANNNLKEVRNASSGVNVEQTLYDDKSRRIATIANGVTTLYIYNARNCIAEYSNEDFSSFELKNSYIWSPEISNIQKGVGGIGCLLRVTNHGSTVTNFFPTYDGNGNITEYIDQSGQTICHYEYDAFGNITNTIPDNPIIENLTYRFSTKSQSFATGLYYYGYRHYHPVTGRWINRDPMEEVGGLNIFSFTANSPINFVDTDGRFLAELIIAAAVISVVITAYQYIKSGVKTKAAQNAMSDQAEGAEELYNTITFPDEYPDNDAEEMLDDAQDKVEEAASNVPDVIDGVPGHIMSGPCAGPKLTNLSDPGDVVEVTGDILEIISSLRKSKCEKCCDISVNIKSIYQTMQELGYQPTNNHNTVFGRYFRSPKGRGLPPPDEINAELKRLYQKMCYME